MIIENKEAIKDFLKKEAENVAVQRTAVGKAHAWPIKMGLDFICDPIRSVVRVEVYANFGNGKGVEVIYKFDTVEEFEEFSSTSIKAGQ